MKIDFVKLEKELEAKSKNSIDDFIKYILFELQSPIEDYFLAIELLKNNYFKTRDLRVAILGAYLSSTWLSFKKNPFLKPLDEHLPTTDNQNKAIIYYLFAYDIYMKCEQKDSKEYSDYLIKSISHSNNFVYNYIRLAEISTEKDKLKLLKKAILNIKTVWSEKQLQEIPFDYFLNFDNFINEFILGIDISSFEYEELLKKIKH